MKSIVIFIIFFQFALFDCQSQDRIIYNYSERPLVREDYQKLQTTTSSRFKRRYDLIYVQLSKFSQQTIHVFKEDFKDGIEQKGLDVKRVIPEIIGEELGRKIYSINYQTQQILVDLGIKAEFVPGNALDVLNIIDRQGSKKFERIFILDFEPVIEESKDNEEIIVEGDFEGVKGDILSFKIVNPKPTAIYQWIDNINGVEIKRGTWVDYKLLYYTKVICNEIINGEITQSKSFDVTLQSLKLVDSGKDIGIDLDPKFEYNGYYDIKKFSGYFTIDSNKKNSYFLYRFKFLDSDELPSFGLLLNRKLAVDNYTLRIYSLYWKDKIYEENFNRLKINLGGASAQFFPELIDVDVIRFPSDTDKKLTFEYNCGYQKGKIQTTDLEYILEIEGYDERNVSIGKDSLHVFFSACP